MALHYRLAWLLVTAWAFKKNLKQFFENEQFWLAVSIATAQQVFCRCCWRAMG
jgi:hypothetical protein